MAEYTIDKIEYGDNVYKLQDNVSGYVSGGNVIPYLTCTDNADTVAKTTTLVTGTLPATLTTGTRVAVRFTNSNTASNPKITIGSYGAIAIKRYGTTAPSTSAVTSWNAGNVITLVYDGTYWMMADWTTTNTTYSEISAANITNGSGSTTGLVTGRRAKAAVEAFQTDEKVGISLVESDTMYYPIVGTDTATASREYDSDFIYVGTTGTTSTIGTASISLGNPSGSTTEGNKRGMIRLYGSGSGHTRIYTNAANGTDVYFPNKGGTIALTDDITDEKLVVSQITERTLTYYPILGASIGGVNINTASTRQYDKGLSYSGNSAGTISHLTIGDYSLSDPSAHKTGTLDIVGASGGHQIVSGADNGGIYSITLPKQQGTIALTSDIPADEKVSTTIDAVNDTVYYPIFGTDSTTASTKKIDTSGFKYSTYNGTASVLGTSILYIGNSISQGYANNKRGSIYLYSASGYKHTIYGGTNGCSNDRTITLPDKTGTVALTSDIPSNIVNTITTTAGAHTAITSSTGAVSFKVPTTAAHVGAATSDHVHGNITNGGDITATAPTIASGDQIIINDHSASKITNGPTFDGSTTTTALTPKGTWESFAKSDTNTTYALSGALSSHKFTSTLTAGGSGSGTTTSDFTLAEGTGITITDDTSNRKMTIACSVTNTDTKVSTAAVTSGTTYYPTLGSDTTSAATKFYDKTGISYVGTSGSGTTNGKGTLTLGNDVSGSSGKCGRLVIYDTNQYKAEFLTNSNLSGNRTITIPNASGTIALTSDLSNYVSKPSGGYYGWVLRYEGPSSTFWDADSVYRFGICENDPGVYVYYGGDIVSGIQDAYMTGQHLILTADLINSTTDTRETYMLTDYCVQWVEVDDDGYAVLWFTDIFRIVGNSQKKITVGIYLDEAELEHEFGEITVNISEINDEKAFFYVNSLTSVTISSTNTPIKLPINGMTSGVGFTYDSTNKGIICHKTSRYAISAQIGLDTATAGDLIGLHIYKDGTGIIGPCYHRVGGNYDSALLLPTIVTLEKDSVYTVYIRNNTASRGKTSTGTRISCWEVQ